MLPTGTNRNGGYYYGSNNPPNIAASARKHLSATATKSYSSPVILLLCFVSFMLGRYVDSLLRTPPMDSPLLDAPLVTSSPSPVTAPAIIKPPSLTTTSSTATATNANGNLDPDVTRVISALERPLYTVPDGMSHYTHYPYQILSWWPRSQYYPRLLTEAECDHIVALGERILAPSGLALKRDDDPDAQKDVRTSSGTFLTRQQDPDGVLARIEERLAEITMLPASQGEAFNLLRYVNGQHYDAHLDVFREEDYGPQPSQRLVTVLLYLSDVEEGGETIFPLDGPNGLDRKNQPGFSYKSCDTGLKVKPKKGDALVFWSLHPDGKYDEHSLHGGCPTTMGVKWVATKWIRNK